MTNGHGRIEMVSLISQRDREIVTMRQELNALKKDHERIVRKVERLMKALATLQKRKVKAGDDL